jgi:hypothetical protein
MLPVVPFVILLIVLYIPKHTLRIITMCFLLAPFMFGMNITDDLRGSGATSAAIKFNISGQEISIDAARGPIFAEQEKRRNKMEYVDRVCDYLDTTYQRQIVICGWWYNEVLTEQRLRPAVSADSAAWFSCWDPHQEYCLKFYATCNELRLEKSKMLYSGDVKIFYLPEQDLYNDQMFGQSCTNEYAEPFPVK